MFLLTLLITTISLAVCDELPSKEFIELSGGELRDCLCSAAGLWPR